MLRFDISLDCVTDVAACCSWPDRGNAAHHRLVCNVDQTLGATWNFADRKHAAGIAVPTVEDERHVNIDDISIFQWFVAGNSVTHDVIEIGRASCRERLCDAVTS